MTAARRASVRASYARILILKPSSLGDIVHALPVLVALRRAYPEAFIAWLAATPFAPLLDGHPLLDEVLVFDRGRYGKMLVQPRALRDFARFVALLRRKRFDLVLDLQGLVRSGFLAWASGARERIGFAQAREFAPLFYTRRVRCPPEARHAVDKHLWLARQLRLPIEPVVFPLAIREEERAAARECLTRAAGEPVERYHVVVPGARWETKRWAPDRLGELVDRIQQFAARSRRCVLLGSAVDRVVADQVIAAARTKVIDLVGKTTLREMAVLIEQADHVLCHDSGPMHIAAALNKPLTAIFGPTDPRRTGPYQPSAGIVATPIECSPCFRRSCDHHSCMQRLTVEEVLRVMAPAFSQPPATKPLASPRSLQPQADPSKVVVRSS